MSAAGFMRGERYAGRRWALGVVSGLLLALLPAGTAHAAGYGRLAGLVFDTQGTPLMGATVMILGPTAIATEMTSQTVERVITDAHGRFSVEHLIPGWYSLKVISPTRLPAMRNGIRVAAGETAIARFVLADTFAPVRFQVPNSSVSTWGDDWKWVLRTSSTTRPILRYREETPKAKVTSKKEAKRAPLPSQRVIAVLPGSSRRDPLSQDTGADSVVAYLRPLSQDSDLLVAGAYGPASTQAGSVMTVFRRVTPAGNSQEMGLAIHQFSLADGLSLPLARLGRASAPGAQGMVLNYSGTRLISPKVMVTAGMAVDYLNSLGDVLSAQPHMKLEYQATDSTVVAVQFGPGSADGADNLLERVGMWNAFPRITQRDNRLQMEKLNHAEVSVAHRVGKSGRFQAAAFHDDLHNAAVLGMGGTTSATWLYGNYLPNPAAPNGFVLNGGNYQGAGFRAVYSQTFGEHTEALVDFSNSSALVAHVPAAGAAIGNWPGMLRAEPTNSLTGKFSSEIPATRTRVITSYEWIPQGRVTLVDPYGQALLQTQPYLDVQIRQPLPNFLPVHIEALADFRNILGQGYVPVSQGANGKPFVLSSGYRSIRGGFSVQF